MKPQGNLTRILRNSDLIQFFFFNVLVSTVVGLVVWIVTGEDISSLIISLLTSMLLLIIELRFQLTLAKEDISLILHVQQASLDDQFLFTVWQQVIEEYTGLLVKEDKFFIDRARDVLNECRATLTKLKEGHFEVSHGFVYSYMTALMKQAKHSLFATSLVKSEFWFRGGGADYLNENYNAAKRGVSIIRVFIITGIEELSQELRDLMATQEQANIDVRIAFTRDLSPDLIQDMAIWDEKYVEYLDVIPGSKEMRGTHFFSGEAEIYRANVIRRRILEEARTASEVLQSLAPPPTS